MQGRRGDGAGRVELGHSWAGEGPGTHRNTLHFCGPNRQTWLLASWIAMKRFRASFHLSPSARALQPIPFQLYLEHQGRMLHVGSGTDRRMCRRTRTHSPHPPPCPLAVHDSWAI